MENDINAKLAEQDVKLQQILEASEASRKYLRTMVIINILMLVLPAIGFFFVLPLLGGLVPGLSAFGG